jgi:hypothetical protein
VATGEVVASNSEPDWTIGTQAGEEVLPESETGKATGTNAEGASESDALPAVPVMTTRPANSKSDRTHQIEEKRKAIAIRAALIAMATLVAALFAGVQCGRLLPVAKLLALKTMQAQVALLIVWALRW